MGTTVFTRRREKVAWIFPRGNNGFHTDLRVIPEAMTLCGAPVVFGLKKQMLSNAPELEAVVRRWVEVNR